MNNEIEYLVYIEKILNENDELEQKINKLNDSLELEKKARKKTSILIMFLFLCVILLTIGLVFSFIL